MGSLPCPLTFKAVPFQLEVVRDESLRIEGDSALVSPPPPQTLTAIITCMEVGDRHVWQATRPYATDVPDPYLEALNPSVPEYAWAQCLQVPLRAMKLA